MMKSHVLDRGGFSYARSDSGSSVSPRDSGLVTSLHFAETRCGGVLDIECQPTAGHSCLAFASAGLDAIGSFITESMENLPGTDLKATIYTTTTFWVDMDGDWDSLDSNTGAIVVTPSVELTITHTGNGLFAISGMIRNDDEDDSHGWVPYNNTYDAKDPTSIFQITTSVDKTWDVDANGGKSIGFLQWSYMSIGATIEAEVGQPKPLPTEIEFSFDATTTVNNLTIDE